MTDKRAEALRMISEHPHWKTESIEMAETQMDTTAPHTEFTEVGKLKMSATVLALHAENDRLHAEKDAKQDVLSQLRIDYHNYTVEQMKVQKEYQEEIQQLTADNADLVDAAAHARGLLADDYFENWEQAHDILHDVITRPHPGSAILQRIEKLEAVADKARAARQAVQDIEKEFGG